MKRQGPLQILLVTSLLYALHVIAATELCFWGAQILSWEAYHLLHIISPLSVQDVSAPQMLVRHLAFFSLGTGTAAGFVNMLALRNRLAKYVWILPFVCLCWHMAQFHSQSVLTPSWQSALSHFFGAGCIAPTSMKELDATSFPCFDQINVTCPFYTSIGYSLGAKVFFDYSYPGQRNTSAPSAVPRSVN